MSTLVESLWIGGVVAFYPIIAVLTLIALLHSGNVIYRDRTVTQQLVRNGKSLRPPSLPETIRPKNCDHTMRLKDAVWIKSTPEAFFEFFENMELHYLRWHPDHRVFRWSEGRGAETGVSFYFEEVIGGKLMKKHVTFTRVEPPNYLEFTFTNRLLRMVLPRISFRAETSTGGIQVTAEIVVRTGPVGAWLNRREFNAVRQHMREEGENLKLILESAA